MKKRWFAIGAVALLLIISIIIVWLNSNRHYEDNNPLCRMPSSAAIVIKINGIGNYKQTVSKTTYGNKFSYLFFADLVTKAMHNAIDAIDSIARNELINDRTIYVSYYAAVNDTAGKTLLAFPLKSYADGVGLMTAVHGMAGTNNLKSEVLTFDGHEVLHVDVGADPFYITTSNECLFATDDIPLLRKVLLGTEPVLADDQCFSTLHRTTSPSAPLSVFVNVASMDSLSVFDATVRTMSTWGDWFELDLDIQSTLLSGNGFLLSGKPTFFSCLASHTPVALTIDECIPSSAQIFASIAPFKRGTNDEFYVRHLRENDINNVYFNMCEAAKKATGIDVESEISKVFEGELALFSFSESLSDPKNACLVINEKNGTISQAILNGVLCAMHGISAPEEVDVISPIPSLSIPVYKAFDEDDETFILSDVLGKQPSKYYLRYENTLMFADTISVLKHSLYERLQNRTYANDANYRAFRTNFSSDNIMFVYCTSKAMRYITMLTDSVANTKNLDAISDFYGFGMQISNVSGLPYIMASGLYEPHKTEAQPTAWQCKMDTTLVGQPWAVINHNTHEIEYLVQDVENRIHLINSSGLVLWSRKIDGRIIGPLTQIDYYCNGKLQYLFATKDAIHLIDRNGNDTARFPIQLKHAATGGVTYLDYGNPNEFRLFVPCANKRVILYDKNCKVVDGWEMKPTEGIVSTPVDHWVSNNKDYLIHADNYRCYITDRRGNERIAVKPIAPNPHSRTYLVRGNTPEAALVIATADGKLASIDIATSEVTYADIDSMGQTPYFMLQYHGSDNLVFVDKRRIVLTDGRGKVKNIRLLKLSELSNVELLSDNKISVWDKADQLAYLFDNNGNLIDGFPVHVNGPYVITQHNNLFHVVEAADNTLTNYLK